MSRSIDADVRKIRSGIRPKFVVLIALLLAGCSPTRGCAESNFDLAPESRLPRWFSLSPGRGRSDVTVKMTYFVGLIGGTTANFVLRDSEGHKLVEVEGRVRDDQPLTLVPDPGTGPLPYPNYAIVTIDGVTEFIEHREKGPLFYVTDDADVRRMLGALR